MQFMLRNEWHCSFLEPDVKTVLPRKIALKNHNKIFEMARRGGCPLDLAAEQMIQHGIEIDRGGVWLELSEEQYQKLKRRGR